jgi:GGDEF domain-containing protein
MFHQQQGKSSHAAPRSLRLPKSPGIPGYGDVQFVSGEALKIIGRTVELPYTSHDKKSDFILSVKYDHEEGDPNWSLYEVQAGNNKTIWHHPSRDLSLICALLSSTSGINVVEDVLPTAAIMGGRGEMGYGAQPAGATGTAAPASPGGIIFDPPNPGAKATLEGDLNNLQVPNLLQSINLAKMTGKLDVKTLTEGAEVYFHDGIPLHCKLKDVQGDAALVELICWTHGEFRFWPDIKTTGRTINKRLESMLMEGVALLDQSKYLETNGLRLESCLVKKNAMISEEEFRARLSKGAPIGFEQQLDFYELIDNRNTLFDLLRKRPMTKTQWTPILFNLVSCGLVNITDQAPTQNRLANLKSLGVDENAVQSVMKNLIRTETGILSFPSFIYFLDQEFLRYEHFNHPFSIIIFSMGQRRGGPDSGLVESLQMLAVRRAMQRISLVKRNIDMLGHYETFDYAMLLPSTNSAAASALATRISDVLREAPLSSDMDVRSLALAFGVATVPEDCQEMDKLLVSARKARDKAKMSNQRVVLAREILVQAQQQPGPSI